MSQVAKSFKSMSCIEPTDLITETLRLLADGPKPAVQLPESGLDQLRQLQWVMGDPVVELTGIVGRCFSLSGQSPMET